MRKLLFAFYLLVGPVCVLFIDLPYPAGLVLAGATLVSGTLVGLIHLRQRSNLQRCGVALGAGLGILGGLLFWGMWVLALYDVDYGKNVDLFWRINLAWTLALVVFSPAVGALLSLRFVRSLAARQ